MEQITRFSAKDFLIEKNALAWQTHATLRYEVMDNIDKIFDYTEHLEAQLKALQDKELTFCEVETAKLKAELATYKDNVVAEYEASAGCCYNFCSEFFVNKASVGNHKVIILKEQK